MTRDYEEFLAEAGPLRQGLYTLLGRAFLFPPEASWRNAFCEESFSSLVREAYGERVHNAYEAFREYLRENETATAEWEQEFQDLFKVPLGRYVTPYESVFRDTRVVDGKAVSGLLLGPSAESVQRYYRLACAELPEEPKELPDHIGFELLFMAYLCGKESEFRQAGQQSFLLRALQIQRDFLSEHITQWLPDLRQKIYRHARLPLYPFLADLAVALTQGDMLMLEEVLQSFEDRENA